VFKLHKLFAQFRNSLEDVECTSQPETVRIEVGHKQSEKQKIQEVAMLVHANPRL
jgi:hypothetical protein